MPVLCSLVKKERERELSFMLKWYFLCLVYKKGAKKIIKMKMMNLCFRERGKTEREIENGKRE